MVKYKSADTQGATNLAVYHTYFHTQLQKSASSRPTAAWHLKTDQAFNRIDGQGSIPREENFSELSRFGRR
jgi:hypothetical protein